MFVFRLWPFGKFFLLQKNMEQIHALQDGERVEKRFRPAENNNCGLLIRETRKAVSETERCKEKQQKNSHLEKFAKKHGVKVVYLPEDPQARGEFLDAEWTERKNAIRRVQEILEDQHTIKEEFLRVLRDGEKSHIRKRKIFLEKIKEAKNELEKIEYQNLVRSEFSAIETLLMKIKKIVENGSYTSKSYEQMERLWDILLAHFRYQLEAMEDTYCSMGLSPEKKRQLLELPSSRDLYYTADGSRKTHVDFGCGDGGSLKQLIRDFYLRFGCPQEVVGKFPGKLASKTIEKIRKSIAEYLDGTLRDVTLRDTDSHFIGIELAKEYIEDLEKHGIKAEKGNICARFNKLKRQTKGVIAENTTDIVESNFTLDRVEKPDRLVKNIAKTLKAGGRFIVTTKTIIDSESDGAGKRNSVQYSRKNKLKAKKATETLEKLFECLRKHGLEPQTIAQTKMDIISSDCNTKNRPKSFRALAIAGVKRHK